MREEHDRLVAAIESYLVYAYFPELNPEESEDAFLELGKACGAFDRRAHELGMDSGLGLENLLSPGFCLPGLAEDFEFGSGPID